MLSDFRLRLRSLFHCRATESELSDDLRFGILGFCSGGFIRGLCAPVHFAEPPAVDFVGEFLC
jgi:hypothetical protein